MDEKSEIAKKHSKLKETWNKRKEEKAEREEEEE